MENNNEQLMSPKDVYLKLDFVGDLLVESLGNFTFKSRRFQIPLNRSVISLVLNSARSNNFYDLINFNRYIKLKSEKDIYRPKRAYKISPIKLERKTSKLTQLA